MERPDGGTGAGGEALLQPGCNAHLANLFGLEYDSRLMAGRDILSDEPGLVIFSNYSFLTEEGAYNSVLDEFRSWDGSPPDEAYVQSQIAEVQNRVPIRHDPGPRLLPGWP